MESKATRMRLTTRGKVVFSSLIAGVVVFSTLIFSSSDASARSADIQDQAIYVTVLTGDTLWDIAATIDPQSDPRDLVFELMHLNDLPTAELSRGQELLIPKR